MTVDAVLVLQRSDVVRIAAAPARHAGARLLFVDPGLLDAAAQRGLTEGEKHEYRRPDLGPDLQQARAASEAMARATFVDLQLTAERERLWGEGGQALSGWDVGPFFTVGLGRCFAILPSGADDAIDDHCARMNGARVQPGCSDDSGSNSDFLSVPQLRALIDKHMENPHVAHH
jgi:hypothetical protein